MEGTTDIVDPAVEEYEAESSREVRIPTKEDSLENIQSYTYHEPG